MTYSSRGPVTCMTVKILKQPELQSRIANPGNNPPALTPAQFVHFITTSSTVK